MKIGPKYKIARRLGAPVFEKTQTQKYTLNLERKGKRGNNFSKPKSEFGNQMNEKQKARFVYGLSERQFSNYVRSAIRSKPADAPSIIFESLECRVDNVAFRIGLSTTRLGARQLVSHGHLKINNRKINTPSMKLRVGDKITINDRSKSKPIFQIIEDKINTVNLPSWITRISDKNEWQIIGKPVFVKSENLFDLNTVIEYYSR